MDKYNPRFFKRSTLTTTCLDLTVEGYSIKIGINKKEDCKCLKEDINNFVDWEDKYQMKFNMERCAIGTFEEEQKGW